MTTMKILGACVALLALSACYNLPEKWQQTDADLKRGYARIAPPRPDYPAVYCYKTLSDPECQPVPLPGEEYRLLNYFGSPPYVIQVNHPPNVIFQE